MGTVKHYSQGQFSKLEAGVIRLRAASTLEEMLDRARCLASMDPTGCRALADAAHNATGARSQEAQSLAALFGLTPASRPAESALAQAAWVRHAPEAELANELDAARPICTGETGSAWLRIALAGRGLEQRTHGEATAILDPTRARLHLPDHTINLSRAHRRFALLWALATTPTTMTREALFEQVWGRPWLGEDDKVALQATVSRTRSKLPSPLTILGLPGGSYALHPSWAVFTWRRAPTGGMPLAPLGRDAEAAAARLALREHGQAALVGPPGSGTSHLARALAHSWPAGSVCVDLRFNSLAHAIQQHLGVALAEVPRVLQDRLLVLDHADALEVQPWHESRVLLTRTRPLPRTATISVGSLHPRDAASLAKAWGLPDPEGPATPLDLRLGGVTLQALRPSCRLLLARLLGVPGGARTSTAYQLGSEDTATTLDDLATLETGGFIQLRSGRLVVEDALRHHLQPEPSPARGVRRCEEPALPASLIAQLKKATDCADLDQSHIALRRVLAQCDGLQGQRAQALRSQALVALARVTARSGCPDQNIDLELSTTECHGTLDVHKQHYFGERALWRGELRQARQRLSHAARSAQLLGAWPLAEVAWADLAEACLRQGLVEACRRALSRSAENGEQCRGQRRAIEAALALDLGQTEAARERLKDAPESPAVLLRRGQLQERTGMSPLASYRAAAEGFAHEDRRWLSICLTLLARHSDAEKALLLTQAQRALTPEDSGSAAALTLTRAGLVGEGPAAQRALRLPGHDDAMTFPWDLVRFLCEQPEPGHAQSAHS